MGSRDLSQSLFGQEVGKVEDQTPLAFRLRPSLVEEFVGQNHLWKKHPYLNSKDLPSMILYGPPGCGKTTLAFILAGKMDAELYPFNAVLGGVAELKKIIDGIIELKSLYGKNGVIFIDEIHRFNKAQQDALLPHVEKGTFKLIGATTENPKRTINRALLSRVQQVELKSLTKEDLRKILERALIAEKKTISEPLLEFICDTSSGDARIAINALEIAISFNLSEEREATLEELRELILENGRHFDRDGDRHYDVISAFIKSMRGSDPDAALLWLAVMLDGAEDPMFIARRLVIFASEDVGNADPQALQTAIAALQGVEKIGMPEARIILAQATTYLASTVKSNAAYNGINEALEYVKSKGTIAVPEYLHSTPPSDLKQKYLYPHDYPGHFVSQAYAKESLPNFYRPTEIGREKNIKERLMLLWKNRF